jgi:peptidoglycan/xylan/chitin deacetylase (PgdA/CDA1 family)
MPNTYKLRDDQLSIFLFHGVVESLKHEVRNYNRKHLTKDYFYNKIKELKGQGTPLSMDQVINCYQSGEEYPPRAFVVSFDDGFENNYSVAAPVLKDLNVPAIFYITTDFIENNSMSWIDRIELCIENTTVSKIHLPWHPGEVEMKDNAGKIVILEEIRRHVKSDPSIDVENLIENIFDQCRLASVKSSDDALDLKMSWDQAKRLADDEDYIIGGHSHYHSILSFLSPVDLQNEIDLSLLLLEEKLAYKTVHYSYPEGLEHCYSQAVIQVLQHKGIVCCPSAVEGYNSLADDLFNLKRIMVV